MRFDMTVIVPTRNSARTIAACLASVRAQAGPTIELIVVDNASDDGTAAVAAGYADRVEHWGPERSAQRNRGAALAAADLLLFVDSDMVLEPEVAAEVVAAFRLVPGLDALVIPERAFGSGVWARSRMLEKDIYLGRADAEGQRGFHRSVFEALGGYDEQLTGGEDWDIGDRLRAAGGSIGRINATVWHDEGRISLRAAFAKKRYYGKGLAAWVRLPRRERRRLSRLAAVVRPVPMMRRPVAAAGLVVLKTVEWTGAAVGIIEERWAAR